MTITKAYSKLAFIGGGNMTSAIVGGLLNKNYPANNITISEPFEKRRTELKSLFSKIMVTEHNHEAASEAGTLILAVKPNVARAVLTDKPLADILKNKTSLLISIAAGIRISAFQKWITHSDKLSLIRCMPNTPALVGLGAIGLYAPEKTSVEHKKIAEDVLVSVSAPQGGLVWVKEEDHLDAVTAVSGSGPAYLFYLVELFEKEGIRLGLDSLTARKLASINALGASTMLVEQCLNEDTSVPPSELRKRVTSLNGTTHAAIETFKKDDLGRLVHNALKACYDRSQAIGNELEKQ